MKKKILLLFFITAAGLTACKKSSKKTSTPTSPTSVLTETDLLDRTTWHSILERHEYFDAKNSRLLKVNDSVGVRYKFDKGQVQITDINNNVSNGTYVLSKADSNDVLAVTFNNHTDNYKVVTLNENYLYLIRTLQNATYTEGGVQKVAASERFTFNLKCACN